MTSYNWQKPDWPHFQYDISSIYEQLLAISEKMGLISGKLAHLSEEEQSEAIINLIVEEAANTSEIEGEHISRLDIRSSIKNKLGLNQKMIPVHDKRAKGIAELLLDVRHTFKQPLTKKKLFDWYLMLMSGFINPNFAFAGWRSGDEPMQIISGHHGKPVVHFEAPPSKNVPKEMQKFIRWFNETVPGKTKSIQFAPVRAALALLSPIVTYV